MKEFKDDQGRPWIVALTVASAERVRGLVTIDVDDDVPQPGGTVQRQRKAVPFDLIDAGNIAQTLEVLRSNYGKIGEVLYAICRKQSDDRGISREQFLEGLRGDAIEAGVKAIEEELVDFFPPRLRRMVGLLVGKTNELAAEAMGKAEEQLKAFTLETAVSGGSSTKPQESSASTPETGPSGSS